MGSPLGAKYADGRLLSSSSNSCAMLGILIFALVNLSFLISIIKGVNTKRVQVKVCSIICLVGRLHLPLPYLVPINGPEEMMFLNILHFWPEVWVLCEDGLDKIPCSTHQIFGEIQLPTTTLLHDDSGVLSIILVLKWSESAEHFTDQYA